jgi:hypothetical protein
MATSTPLAAVSELRAGLDAVARALATADLDGLLAAESVMAAAMEHVSRITDVGDGAEAVRAELAAARAALERCRVLGGSLTQFADCTLVAMGRATTYERPGAARTAVPPAVGRLRASL